MRTLPLILLLAACGGAESSDDSSAGLADDPRYDRSTWPETVGTDARPATVVTPANWDGETALPVVLMLHGYGASGILQDLVFQFAPRVDEYGFLLVLPDGTVDAGGSQFWNATEVCCNFYGSDVNDVKYLKGVLDDMEDSFPVDPERITVVGHSNGGFMSYRMACEDSERIAAIAPLAGLAFTDASDCKATEPVSVLHMHGTDDPDVPYSGGFGPSAETSLSRWTDRAGCSDSGSADGTRDYVVDAEGEETVVTRFAEGCDEDVVTELWKMEGVGHIPAFTDAYRDDLIEWLLARKKRR